MRLSARRLNRTLLHRQHLLDRTPVPAEDMADHLIGLQGQETLPPYLSLFARVTDFDPHAVSQGLDAGRWVRLSSLRGTLHLHTAADALALRPWLQESLDRQLRNRVSVEPARVREVATEILADGPVDQRKLAERLAARLPGTASDLWVVARVTMPVVQLPPRGTWGGSGGIVLDELERWTGGTLEVPTTEDVIRRYLRAFGPASAGDVGYWSGVTRLRPALRGMDDLVRHEDESGRELFDVADGELADEDVHAPVRLLGTYDNLWLSHTGRDRVTGPASRGNWMGANGGVANTVFVDGWLTGLWRVIDGRVDVTQLFRDLHPVEQDELDGEAERVEQLLSR